MEDERREVVTSLPETFQPCHRRILVLHGQAAVEADQVQLGDQAAPVQLPPAGHAESESPPGPVPSAVGQETGSGGMVGDQFSVLGVDMGNPVTELGRENDWIHTGQKQIGGVEVETEPRVAIDRLERQISGF